LRPATRARTARSAVDRTTADAPPRGAMPAVLAVADFADAAPPSARATAAPARASARAHRDDAAAIRRATAAAIASRRARGGSSHAPRVARRDALSLDGRGFP